MPPPVPLMILTGPVGVGKTTIATAVSDALDDADIPHALVDLDHLRWCFPRPLDDPHHVRLGLRNLATIWTNYRAAGADRLVIADVIESRAELADYRSAVPGAEILVIRLHAPLPTIERQLRGRETGASLDWHIARAAELAAQMDRDRVEDVLIETEGKSAAAVAHEALARAGWSSSDA